MSISDKKQMYTLTIYLSEEYTYFVKTVVFDVNNKIIKSTESNSSVMFYSLEKGLYTLRIELNGGIKDEILLLDRNLIYQISDMASDSFSKTISPPTQFSSALLGNTYGSTHEYYTNPAIEYSQTSTFTWKSEENSNSSLFIFLRFPSLKIYENFKGLYPNGFFYDFEIVDKSGNLLTSFKSKEDVSINEEYGWVAFNAKLPSGMYYLIYRGTKSRQVPLYIYKDWHTQFFMTLEKEPIFGSIRMFLSKSRNFDPNEKNSKYIDILLDKLQNKDYTLNDELIQSAAYGKFDSPILGLICAYIYLKSDNNKNDSLFRIITNNLQSVILKNNEMSSDILALNLLASNHFSEYENINRYRNESIGIDGTPMLRIGYETIVKASLENKDLIPEDSINDQIYENLYFDSPFNTFTPISFSNILDEYGPYNKVYNEIYHRGIYDENISDIIGSYFLPYISSGNELYIRESWIRSTIIDIIKTDQNITINKLASIIRAPVNTIFRLLKDWQKDLKKDIEKWVLVQLIEDNKRTKNPFLDLGNCGLDNFLPTEILDCIWLKRINFGANYFVKANQKTQETENNLEGNKFNGFELSILSKLPHLEILDFCGIEKMANYGFLENISNLKEIDFRFNHIEDMNFLKNLPKLQTLYLRNNYIKDCSFLGKLIELKNLDLSSNSEIKDYSFLEGLSKLETLDILYNQVTNISFLADLFQLKLLILSSNNIIDISSLQNLSQLHTLDIGDNKINDISSLQNLSQLHTLDVSDNRISSIKPLVPLLKKGLKLVFDWQNYKVNTINIKDNPITIPPMNVINQGNEAIIKYFE